MGLHKALIAGAQFGFSSVNPTLAISTNHDLFFKCPAVSNSFYAAALKAEFQSDGLVTCSLFQATASGDGTGQTVFNKNQIGTPPTSPATVFLTPTGLSAQSAANTLVQGLATLSEDFCTGCWILKPNTNYVIRIANGAAAQRAVAVQLDWTVIPNQDFLRGAWPGAGSY